MNDSMKMFVAAGIGFLLGVLGTVMFQQMAPKAMTNEVVNDVSNGTVATVTEAATQVMDAMNAEWRASLTEQNGSGQNGTVMLTDEDGKTKVSIDMVTNPGASVSASQPAHIHVGSCANLGAVKYPLTNVVNGKSETVIDATIDELKKSLPLAVNIHKSASELTIYTACGDLK